MIDIEVPLFNQVYEAVQAEYPNVRVLNDRPLSIAKFPCVVCVEDDNTTYSRSRDITTKESFAEIMWTVDVYCDNKSGAKTLCKKIASLVDEVFIGLRFTRMMLSPMPNQDPQIIRYTGRYRAVVAAPIVTERAGELPDKEYYLYRR